MKRPAVILISTLSLLASVEAQDWNGYFSMATFGAGGGSDENGWLNFECADPSSGFSTAGRAYMQMRLMEGVQLSKNSLPADVAFWVGDSQSYLFPMVLTPDTTNGLSYAYSAETTQEMLDFIAALREGNSVTAFLDDVRLIRIELQNSSSALSAIEGCVADGAA